MEEQQVILNTEKEKFLASLQDFLSGLPADTKSVQATLYAYTDSYDDYNDKTKCVAEVDSWYVLPEEARIELLSDAVSFALKKVNEYVVASDDDTEEGLKEKELLGLELKSMFKSLARSFSLYVENIDTAAVAGEQLEKLFKGILDYRERDVYTMAIGVFSKKKGLEEQMDDLQWKLMSSIGIKSSPQKKPAAKTTPKSAEKKPEEKAPEKKEPEVKAPIQAPAKP